MKIFATRQVPGDSFEKLKASGHEVKVSPFDRPLNGEELLELGSGADAILSLLTDKIDADVIEAIGPQLKVVSNYAVGFDNIKVPDATAKGVVVTNTPSDEVNESVAEHTWGLTMALARRIVEADQAVRMGAYKGWEPGIFLGFNLRGKTLGIVGLGRIGTMVAERAKGFGVNILYTKRTPEPEAESQLGIKFAKLDDLLATSDIVSLHVPLNDETRHMMNKETLGKMKQGAVIVNTARGPIIREADLVEALKSGHLGGAALDVFENEPNINPELIGMENVVLTPHTASATWEARNKMCEQAVAAVLDTLAGKKPENIVNPEVWDKRRT